MKNTPFLLLGLLMWPVANSASAQDKTPKPTKKSQGSFAKLAEKRLLSQPQNKKLSPDVVEKLRADFLKAQGLQNPKANPASPVLTPFTPPSTL